ncbi:MAG TPA: ABC transporter ATP-binding protein [Candidatus Hydrogenedens sp.]|nr:ABC transporter ATP-binding protein [Candidatus Hydrogenedens sp.]HPP58884.1 ABC transporter ATP-binding protein [Candidatus Hydrogenedens sp.]
MIKSSEAINDSIIVKTEKLNKTFGKKIALKNVSIEVRRGRVFGLVGENGAGKTTLINHILGAYYAEEGSVLVFGLNPVLHPKEVLSRIGYLSETRDMPRWMRIEQFIRYMSAFYPSWDMEYAYRLLEQFELDPKRRIRALSRGELARTGLLVAMAHRPDLLLLDEPSSGLDPVARMDILSAVVRSVAEEGRTVLFSSHLLDEVERVADDVCMIHHGHVVMNGGLDEIRNRFHIYEVQKSGEDADFETISGVVRVLKLGHGYQVLYEGDIEEGKSKIQQKGGVIINIQPPSLEDVFIAYVKCHKKEVNL